MSQYLALPSTGLANADDTVIEPLPQSQVDYLSHVWKEEDVWRSWRNMTRQKNAIANGTRLENASWRTWWKQRNKLKTISPETLNWLKDSDVTWLYGPLHSAVDPVPPPKISTPQDRLGLETSTGNAFGTTAPTTAVNRVPLKPILKHRSIFEMLTHQMPASPINDGYIEFDDTVGPGDYFPAEPASGPSPSRPAIPHTKSDTNLLATSLRTRKASPQGKDDQYHDPHHHHASPPAHTPSTSGSPHRAPSDAENGKRHISFNTFVEQCIAIEKPADQPSDDESSDDEMDDDDEESDEDGVLEFRTRSGSMPLPPAPKKPSLVRHHSHSTSDRNTHAHHVTIAPIAPTILKSSESFPGLSPAVVFVPPNGSVYGSIVPPVQFQLDEEVPFASARRGRGAASHSSSATYTPTVAHPAAHFDGDSDDTPDLGFGDQFRSGSGTASPRGRRDGTGAARYGATGASGRRHQRSSPSQSPEPTAVTTQSVGSATRPVDIYNRGHLQASVSSSPDTLSPEPYPTRGRTITTTSGVYSGHSSSSNERSESRGRTSVRGSSSSGLSDRSRSGSRHRVGESSPIGSLSPNPSRSSLSAVATTVAVGTSSSPSPPSPRSPPETSSASGASSALKSAMKQRSVDFVRPSLVINRDQLEATAGAQSNSGGASDVSTDRHDYWADAPGQEPLSMPSRAQAAPTRSSAVDPTDDGLVGRAVSSARGMLRGILFNTPPTAAATARD